MTDIKNNITTSEHVATYENGFTMYQVKANGERIKVCTIRKEEVPFISTDEKIFEALEEAFEKKNTTTIGEEMSEQQEKQAEQGSTQKAVFARYKEKEKLVVTPDKVLFLKQAEKSNLVLAEELELANLEYFRKLKRDNKVTESLEEHYIMKHRVRANERENAFYYLMDLGIEADTEERREAIFRLKLADIKMENVANILKILDVDMLEVLFL